MEGGAHLTSDYGRTHCRNVMGMQVICTHIVFGSKWRYLQLAFFDVLNRNLVRLHIMQVAICSKYTIGLLRIRTSKSRGSRNEKWVWSRVLALTFYITSHTFLLLELEYDNHKTDI